MPNVKIRDFLKLCGGNDETTIKFWECDEREELTLTIEEALDEKFSEMLDSEIASWEMEDGVICIFYFREEN